MPRLGVELAIQEYQSGRKENLKEESKGCVCCDLTDNYVSVCVVYTQRCEHKGVRSNLAGERGRDWCSFFFNISVYSLPYFLSCAHVCHPSRLYFTHLLISLRFCLGFPVYPPVILCLPPLLTHLPFLSP